MEGERGNDDGCGRKVGAVAMVVVEKGVRSTLRFFLVKTKGGRFTHLYLGLPPSIAIDGGRDRTMRKKM